MSDEIISISAGPRFKTAMIIAVIADALQIVVFPSFVEGALSLSMTYSTSESRLC
jgi:hypothetical protein